MNATEATDLSSPSVRLQLPPSPVSIAIGRSVIRRIVTFHDGDAESSFLVAFSEILANAVDEHQRLGLGDAIGVEITLGLRERVCVTDAGSGIDRADDAATDTSAADPTNGVPERGRGLALARAFVDDLELDSTPHGTTATLPLHGFGIVR